jgi:hypothetical protein
MESNHDASTISARHEADQEYLEHLEYHEERQRQVESASRAPRWQAALGRGLWLLALVGALIPLIPGFQEFRALLGSPCDGTSCVYYQQLTRSQAASLRGIHISLDAYVAITLTLAVVSMLVCLTVSAFLIWRKPNDRMAVLVALLLVAFIPLNVIAPLPFGPTPWTSPYSYALFALGMLLAVVFSLFPTGRFVPRELRWGIIVIAAMQIVSNFIPLPNLDPNLYSSSVAWLLTLAAMAALTVAQVYRYRYVSTPLQRQQTKWVVLGLAIPIALLAAETLVTLAIPGAVQGSALVVLVINESDFFAPLLLAIGFGFAVMRYRLWEIDSLINRALVYGALTLLLTSLYAGLVFGLQSAFRTVIGQSGEDNIAIVISTLVIAALILPARRWIQTIIDHRFYRSKYNAARTLQGFSDSLRHEIHVDALRERLLQVVDKTVQPAHASLWLRPDATPAATPDATPAATPEASEDDADG